MPPVEITSLPFVTRKMLDFERNVTFQLRIRTHSLLTSGVTIQGATKSGQFTFKVTLDGLGTQQTTSFNIHDIPLWIIVSAGAATVNRGEIYAVVDILINQDAVYRLSAGYIYSKFHLAWPNANLVEPHPQVGDFKTVSGANPAAGAEVLITVPANELWRIRSVRFTLVAAAAAASRIVHLIFTNNTGVLAECISATAQIISETKTYTAFPTNAGGSVSDDNDLIIPIPSDIWLSPGGTITTLTTALNGSDDYGVPVATIEKYIWTTAT